MQRHRKGSKKQPFPVRRPEIVVTPSPAEPFAVDCRELPWWFAIPEVGDRTLWAMYDPPDWRVTYVYDMSAARRANIHGVDGVEIVSEEWEPDKGWCAGERTMYAQMTEDTVGWIAMSYLRDDERVYSTYLDEGFEANWGPAMARHMADRGKYVAQPDGSYVALERGSGEIGAGVFGVTIGDAEHTCLRVLDVRPEPDERGELVEAYLTRDGRTAYWRRYNGRRWKIERYGQAWDEKLPDNDRLVIDGVTYVHWYDCLTSVGLQLDTRGQ